MIHSLRQLLHPHDPAMLDDAIRANRLLHLRGDQQDEFRKLLPWAQFNGLLTIERLVAGDFELMQRGRPAMVDMVAPPVRQAGRSLSHVAVQTLCDQGMSVVLKRIDQLVPKIAALNAMIERACRCAVATNCYASFTRESAFKVHYDTYNLLILQLHGAKRWSFFGQPHDHPVATMPEFDQPTRTDPERTVELTAGDVLFLPRGEFHRAEVDAGESLHLSIRIQPPRVSDVLRWLADRSDTESLGREDVSVLAAPDALEAQADRVKAMLGRMAESLDLSAFLDAQDNRDPARPISLGLSQTIGPDTVVQPSLRRRIALPDGSGNEVVALGKIKVSIDPTERVVLATLLHSDSLTFAALAIAHPDLSIDVVRRTTASLARKSLVFLFDD